MLINGHNKIKDYEIWNLKFLIFSISDNELKIQNFEFFFLQKFSQQPNKKEKLNWP